MHTKISLNGNDWLFKDFLGEDWVWRHSEKPDTKDVRWWRKGAVPGSVHHDLLKLGEIPDPYVDRNSLLVEWVPERTWIYKKSFTVDTAHRGKRVQLVFKGIDYEAKVFLNGKLLVAHKGMYIPVEIDISDSVRYGEDNLLAVVIEKAPDEQPQVSKTSYVHTHKSRMTYWWDFCPRMIHLGIWDDVYLNVTGPARLEDVYVRPALTDDFSMAHVSVSTAIHSGRSLLAVQEIALYHRGVQVAVHRSEHALAEGATNTNCCITLDSPELWWPNGMGEPSLYEAKVTVYEIGAEASVESDARQVTFGIRRIEVVRNETEDGTARPYTFVVNGRKVYIKGWNWVPIDVMYGVERPEKLERLLTLAKRANVNMLRVWGGGLIEKDAFYAWCNRFGIMVWQEFIQSSSGIGNKPSEDPSFVEMMVREAEIIVPLKRNHPSLAVWCGGNELQGGDESPLDDSEPVLGALSAVVKRLDPERYWLPTSPTGRTFSNNLAMIEKDPLGQHDVHGPWEHQGLTAQYTLYNRGTSLLHSEFGVEGMTNPKTLYRTVSDAHRWPANKDNPVYFHRGAWWINEPLVQECFGGIGDVDTLIRASQFLQSEGLRYAVEANLRRQFQSSGTLPWQFNEPYPNTYCTSALDYYAQPKAVYYTVSRAYRPVHISARFEAQIWAERDSFAAEVWAVHAEEQPYRQAKVSMELTGISGKIYAGKTDYADVAEGGSSKLTDFEAPLAELKEELFFLSMTLEDSEGQTISNNRYLFSRTGNLRPMLECPAAELQVNILKQEDAWFVDIANSSGNAALNVRLDDSRDADAAGFVYFDDNYFSMLPGESRRIRVDWQNVPEAERSIEIGGWNTELNRV